MSTATKQAIDLMELLPESEQNFALEFIKKTCHWHGIQDLQKYATERAGTGKSTKGN